MEESYETFEEELGPPRADPPPQRPVRQIRRPEMYTTRRARVETAPVPQQPRAEPRVEPRAEVSFTRTAPLHRALSIQSLTQIETPWENVTLNRCLFVAITILVLTSGFHKLNETLRGQGPVEEEEEDVGLTARYSSTLRQRGQPELETSLWEVLFWWLPDLDDDEDDEEEDDDGEIKRGKPKRRAPAHALRGLRNRPLPDKKLMKQREGKIKDRRAKKVREEETKSKKEKEETQEPEEAESVEEEDEGNEVVPKKNKKVEGLKEKKKTQRG